MAYRYVLDADGTLPGQSFKRQTEDFLDQLQSGIDDAQSSSAQAGEDAATALATAQSAQTDIDALGAAAVTKAGDSTITGGIVFTRPPVIPVVAAGTTTQRDLSQRFGDVINVKDFGAVGDGIADDSSALKDALQAGAGKTVFIPHGTYKCVAHTLTIYSNTTLTADAGTIIRRAFLGGVSGEDSSVLLNAAPLQGESTIHDIAIRNIIFDGNGSEVDDVSFDLTFFSSLPTTNLVIENCEFLDVVDYHAIDLNLCSNVLIRRCRFKGWKLLHATDSTRKQREAIQFDIHSTSEDADRNKKIIIEQCYFGPSDNFGSYMCGVGNHGFGESGETTYFDKVIIRDNQFYLPDSVFYAIHLYVFSNVVIERNTCERTSFCCIRNKFVPRETTDDIYVNSNIIIKDNITDGLLQIEDTDEDSEYRSIAIRAFCWKANVFDWSEVNYAESSVKNIIVKNNVIKHYNKALKFEASGVNSAIIDGNILEDCGRDSTGNTFYFHAQVKHAKIINNVCKRSGTIYISVPSDIATFEQDLIADILISGNSFIDPMQITRVLFIDNITSGLVCKGNVVDDSHTDRNPNYQYFYIASDIIQGGVLRDNYIYSKSSMQSIYNIVDNAQLVKECNYTYVNDAFYSNFGGKFTRKYISFLGDSITTYSGYLPSGNTTFYPNSGDTGDNKVNSVSDTWWWKTFMALGMRLLVNNSWSGSRVTTTVSETSAGCMTRCQSLHDGSTLPDVIIVYMGVNDFSNGVDLGSYDGTTAIPTDTTTFREAYAIMLGKMLTAYPAAEVFVCTLPQWHDAAFPKNNSNVALLAFNRAIEELAQAFGVRLLDFNQSGLGWYSPQSWYIAENNVHPNKLGHSVLANYAISQLDPSVAVRYSI